MKLHRDLTDDDRAVLEVLAAETPKFYRRIEAVQKRLKTLQETAISVGNKILELRKKVDGTDEKAAKELTDREQQFRLLQNSIGVAQTQLAETSDNGASLCIQLRNTIYEATRGLVDSHHADLVERIQPYYHRPYEAVNAAWMTDSVKELQRQLTVDVIPYKVRPSDWSLEQVMQTLPVEAGRAEALLKGGDFLPDFKSEALAEASQ